MPNTYPHNAYELRCPDNEVNELHHPGGPGCRKPPNYQFPFLREDEFKCPRFPPEQCHKDIYSCVVPVPGRCNARLYCSPQMISGTILPEQPLVFFCDPVEYWDSNTRRCELLPTHGWNSTCEVEKSFKCPRKGTYRKDCEKLGGSKVGAGIGHLCLSSKGPEWYIGCFTGYGDRNAYQLRCPPNTTFDLDHEDGPGCHGPLPDSPNE